MMGPQPEKNNSETKDCEGKEKNMGQTPSGWENICSYYPYTFDQDDVDKSAKKVIENLRPDLEDQLKDSSLKVKELSGGMTNKLLIVDVLPGKDQLEKGDKKDKEKILIRVYGEETEKIIDRQDEVRALLTLQENNAAGKFYGVFDNGMCYEHVPGEALTVDTMKDPKISRLVVKETVHMHCIYRQPKDHPVNNIFERMDNMYKLVLEKWENKEQDRKFKETFPNFREQFRDEIDQLREYFQSDKVKSPIVFCHNDLLCGNILYDKEQDQVHFIDFEYAGLNYQGYDLANYFNEFAGVEDVNYDRFPSREFQMDYLKQYLQYWDKAHDSSRDTSANDGRLEELYVTVNKFTVASHLFWILWALFQAKQSKIDFDFLTYANTRFEEYLKRKQDWLSDMKPQGLIR